MPAMPIRERRAVSADTSLSIRSPDDQAYYNPENTHARLQRSFHVRSMAEAALKLSDDQVGQPAGMT